MLPANIIGVRGPNTPEILEVFRQHDVRITPVRDLPGLPGIPGIPGMPYEEDGDEEADEEEYTPEQTIESLVYWEVDRSPHHYALVIPMAEDEVVTFDNIVENVDDIEAAWLKVHETWALRQKREFDLATVWLQSRGFVRGSSVWDRMTWTSPAATARYDGRKWRCGFEGEFEEDTINPAEAFGELACRSRPVEQSWRLIEVLTFPSHLPYLRDFEVVYWTCLRFSRTLPSGAYLELRNLTKPRETGLNWEATLVSKGASVSASGNGVTPEGAVAECYKRLVELTGEFSSSMGLNVEIRRVILRGRSRKGK